MKHFPIFIATEGKSIVLSGGGEAALAKLRLLMKSEASITVYADHAEPRIHTWHREQRLTLIPHALTSDDTLDAILFYAANEDEDEDARVSQIAQQQGALVNIVDNLHDSAFITPAIVDRDPVTVAIGTEGAAPVLARSIKAKLEDWLHPTLGTLVRIGKTFRPKADALPMGRKRRDFWAAYYHSVGPKTMDSLGQTGLDTALEDLLEHHLGTKERQGHVAFVGAGPGDPELLTLKARRLLHEADVVIYDRLVGKGILELARREAVMIDVGKEGFGPSTTQSEINALIIEHAQTGAQVVRLKGGDCGIFGRLDEELDACVAHSVSYSVTPGITSASAAVASIGQSLTKRGRNASVRLLTGHDMQGFADHDWRGLAQEGQVAAIYMGKKSARFIQGRLLMHGAHPKTPVTLVENASHPEQTTVETTLSELPKTILEHDLTGPVMTLYGIAPRHCETFTAIKQQELA